MRGLTASQLVSLPWAWQGPGRQPQRDVHGNEWFEIRIAELPEFFVAATTAEQAIADAGPALEAFIDSFLQANELPPLPDGVVLADLDKYSGSLQITGLQAA